MSKSLDVIFYNLGTASERHKTPRGANRQIARELRAMRRTKPDAILLCEAIGHSLPHLKGYRLIRDTSRPGRANIAAYVRHGHHVSGVHWLDLHRTWGRTKYHGRHPARSYLVMRISGCQVVAAHQPPRYTDNVIRSQREGINRLTHAMDPSMHQNYGKRSAAYRNRQDKCARVVFFDANRQPGDHSGPGPDSLAHALGGQCYGHKIDCAVGVNLKRVHARYVRRYGRVTLHSDHKEALHVTFHYAA